MGRNDDVVPLLVGKTQKRIAWTLFVVMVAAMVVQTATSISSIFAASEDRALAQRSIDALDAAAELERAAQANTVRLVKNTCDEKSYLVRDYCDQSAHFLRCFTLLEKVERLVQLEQRDAVFAALQALEPQTGAVNVWAVDESTPFEDSHLDINTQQTADYFNNSAYYYTQQVHVRSVGCGGWSIGFWKTLPDENGAVVHSLQLAYCRETVTNIRVCGGFDVRAM